MERGRKQSADEETEIETQTGERVERVYVRERASGEMGDERGVIVKRIEPRVLSRHQQRTHTRGQCR